MSNHTLKPANCKSCGAIIIWMKTAKGKNIPVDASSVEVHELEWIEASPTMREAMPSFQHGKHICHFETCPNHSRK